MFSEYAELTSSGKKKVDCWSDKNEKRPHEVSISNGKKFWFNCDVCPHEFHTVLASISIGRWCPYCANNNKKRCIGEDCDFCFNNSFASYDGLTSNGKKKVNCWSDKNEKRPHEVSISNGNKYYFDCDTCPHEFYSSLGHINNGSWCPYCSHNPKRCLDDDCEFCFNNSFASYDGVTSLGKKKWIVGAIRMRRDHVSSQLVVIKKFILIAIRVRILFIVL